MDEVFLLLAREDSAGVEFVIASPKTLFTPINVNSETTNLTLKK